jgi:predicted metal-dependent phosphoesterase TrpH
MIETKADLHLHTNVSDGLKTPVELIDFLFEKGLRAGAITDHDSYDGFLKARDYAEALGFDLLEGLEISCSYRQKECHLLGFGFRTDEPDMASLLRRQRSRRVERAGEMIDKLIRLGFDIDLDEIKAEAGKSSISRNHVANVLVNKGYLATRQQAFDQFLYTNGPAYVPNGFIEPEQAIEMIHACGGVVVLAHPAGLYTYEDLNYFLNAGIDGIEFIHPSHDFKAQKKYKDYAENYGLLLTGGSDYHGQRPYEDQLVGSVCVNRTRIDAIRERCATRVSV